MEFPFDTRSMFEKYRREQRLPKNDFEKQAILIEIVKQIDDKIYSHQEINDLIKKFFDDFAFIRRELVNFGYLKSDPINGTYRIIKRDLTLDDIRNNLVLRRHAKAYKVLPEDKIN